MATMEHTHITSSVGMKEHPVGGRLTAEFLNKNLKSSDAHVVHRIEQDVWSNLLSQEERAKVVRGAIDSNCVVWHYPEMKGPDGYLQLIQMFKAAVPDMTNTINLIAENVAEGDCSIFLTKWTKSGHFTGSDLFGVKATGKPIIIHGFSCIETKGAQITRMDCTMDLIPLAECFPVASSTLLKEGAFAGGAGASGGVLGSLGGMATKAMGALGLGAGAGQPSHTAGTH